MLWVGWARVHGFQCYTMRMGSASWLMLYDLIVCMHAAASKGKAMAIYLAVIGKLLGEAAVITGMLPIPGKALDFLSGVGLRQKSALF